MGEIGGDDIIYLAAYGVSLEEIKETYVPKIVKNISMAVEVIRILITSFLKAKMRKTLLYIIPVVLFFPKVFSTSQFAQC